MIISNAEWNSEKSHMTIFGTLQEHGHVKKIHVMCTAGGVSYLGKGVYIRIRTLEYIT